jgi:hypothetical protein
LQNIEINKLHEHGQEVFIIRTKLEVDTLIDMMLEREREKEHETL